MQNISIHPSSIFYHLHNCRGCRGWAGFYLLQTLDKRIHLGQSAKDMLHKIGCWEDKGSWLNKQLPYITCIAIASIGIHWKERVIIKLDTAGFINCKQQWIHYKFNTWCHTISISLKRRYFVTTACSTSTWCRIWNDLTEGKL